MPLISPPTALLIISIIAGGTALAGFWYRARATTTLTGSTRQLVSTLLATALGAWILFGPPEAATWGGVGAIIGYALGVAAPLLLMAIIAPRLFAHSDAGNGVFGYVSQRYGKSMVYAVATAIAFYLVISLTAGLTAVAKLVQIFAPIPLAWTAAAVIVATLAYSLPGGLRVSMFTDRIQAWIAAPLIVAVLFAGFSLIQSLPGSEADYPQFDLTSSTGIQAGITFFIAVALTNLFHQGQWQRAETASSTGQLRRALIISAAIAAPIVLAFGGFGLLFVATGGAGDPSTALFNVVTTASPLWLAATLIPLGILLFMSSADSAITGLTSLAPKPRVGGAVVIALSLPAAWVAAQGLSVLYLFLLADLICCAIAFPVFYGLYSRRHSTRAALMASATGLVAGLVYFPLPGQPPTHLMEAFLAAAVLPVVLCLLMSTLTRDLRETAAT